MLRAASSKTPGIARAHKRKRVYAIETFAPYEYVVVPSGSCAVTLAKDVPDLLADDPLWADRALAFGARCYELVSFLTDVVGASLQLAERLEQVAVYHDSCSSLRGLGIEAQPRKLLAEVPGLELRTLEEAEKLLRLRRVVLC